MEKKNHIILERKLLIVIRDTQVTQIVLQFSQFLADSPWKIFFYLICHATKSFKLNVTVREIKFLTSFRFIWAYICFISSQE